MRTFFLAVSLLAACAGDERPGPGGSADPVLLDDYCAAFAGGLCEWKAACGCPIDTPCADQVAGCESMLTIVRASIEAGNTTYDGARVRELVDRIEAASCDEDTFDVLGYGAADFLDFGGAFVGTLPPGSACTFGSRAPGDGSVGLSVECARGVCVEGRCVALRDVGEACDETVECFDFSAGRWDQDDRPIVACDGMCQPLLPVGAPCTDGRECDSSSCGSGLCVERAGTGATCASEAECSSFVCEPSGVCGVTDLPVGDPCTSRFECASDACEAGVCTPAACSPDSA